MQNTAPGWHKAFRRIVSLADKAGNPVLCDVPQWTHEEMVRHVECIELNRNLKLPPSYKQFLLDCNGCRNLFHGADLFSLSQLLDPSCIHATDDAIEDLNTPIPCYVSPVKPHWKKDGLICIGIDATGDIVFVLDTNAVHEDGELDVIAWFSGLGMRFPSFRLMLEFLADMMEQNNDPRTSKGAKSARNLQATFAA